MAGTFLFTSMIILVQQQWCRGSHSYYEYLEIFGDKTFADQPVLEQEGSHVGPLLRGSSLSCAATCASYPGFAGSKNGSFCSAFSACEARDNGDSNQCDLLVGRVLDDIVGAQLTSRPGCRVFNITDSTSSSQGLNDWRGRLPSNNSTSPSAVATSPSSAATAAPLTSTAPIGSSNAPSSSASLSTTQSPPVSGPGGAPTTPATVAPAAKSATFSGGTLYIPSLNLTTYDLASGQCHLSGGRLLDLVNISVYSEVCSVLRGTMGIPDSTLLWVHAWYNADCGNINQRWQLKVLNPSCDNVQYAQASTASAFPLCWQRSPETLDFQRSPLTGPIYNFRINLARMMDFATAAVWCQGQTGPNGQALKIANYDHSLWHEILKTFFASDKGTFPCGMHFWVKPAAALNPSCTQYSYVTLDENANYGNLQDALNTNACGVFKYAFCADVPY